MTDHFDNPDWYRAKYNLAATYANWTASAKRPSTDAAKEHRDEATKHAKELLEVTLDALERKVLLPWRKRRRAEVTHFLATDLEPATVVLLLGMATPPKNRNPERDVKPPTRNEIRGALKAGRMLPTGQLLAYVTSRPHLAPKTHYNLACLHLAWGNSNKAETALNKALAVAPSGLRGQLAAEAINDPALESLVKEKASPLRKKLDKIIKDRRVGSRARAD